MVTDDTKLQVLHDHYKDTFSNIQNHLKLRDRLFIFILFVITLMSFQLVSPKESTEAISQFVAQKFDLKSPIDISFLGSIIWFSLLGLVVRYFQTVVYVERQYNYIHQLEEQISPNYDGKAFTREGKSYLSNYPLFSNWASVLYAIIFPILLIAVASIKIISEFCSRVGMSLHLLFNIAIFVCIVISSLLYLFLIHFRR